MNTATTILWFRRDLRLDDNPALRWALERGQAVVPVFIWDPESEGDWAPGAASRAWLHRSLQALAGRLRAIGGELVIRRGPVACALDRLVAETGASAVVWNRCYEPHTVERDAQIKEALLDRGLEVRSFNGSLLFAPNRIENRAGRPFKVFTPFWKHCNTLPVREAGDAPKGPWPAPRARVPSETPASLGLRPSVDWDSGLLGGWEPGEAAALKRLRHFAENLARDYGSDRNRPDRDGCSRLSPHLHWGEISPVRVYHTIRQSGVGEGGTVFLSELGWREFAHHLLFHFPETVDQPLRPEFARFPWKDDPEVLDAWQRGRTGYPIVDAGMRQLWATGWMHNRVRMIVASFLVKHLLQPWQAGVRWFWDTLVDADLANNTLGWQWTAGCGADAAPYFRVFNPMLQGARFDPDGTYVREWVPELAGLRTAVIHQPWEASPGELEKAGIRLGRDFPRPVIDHAEGRRRALAAYDRIRESA